MGWSGWTRRRQWVTSAAVAGALVAMGFVVYIAWRKHGMEISTPVELPFARAGEVLDLEDPWVVHLEANGTLLLGSEPVSLAQLAERVRDAGRPVIVCADANVRVLSFWYVLHSCPRVGTYFAVQDGWRRAVLPATDANLDLMFDGSLLVQSRERTLGSVQHLLYHEIFPLGVLDDADEASALMHDWIDELSERMTASEKTIIAEHIDRLDWSPSCASDEPLAAYVRALDVLHRAGALRVVPLRFQPAAWTAAQPRVPRGAGLGTVGPQHSRASRGEDAIALPGAHEQGAGQFAAYIARMRRPVRIDVGANGELRWMREARSLGQLRELLLQFATTWERRCERLGRRSREGANEQYSTEPVLIRADRHLPWGAFRWLRRVLLGTGYHRLGLQVFGHSDASWSSEERQILGLSGGDGTPYPVGFGEKVFGLAAPWDGSAEGAVFDVLVKPPEEGLHLIYEVTGFPPTDRVPSRNTLLDEYAETANVRVRFDPAIPLWRTLELVATLRTRGHTVFYAQEATEVPYAALASTRLTISPK